MSTLTSAFHTPQGEATFLSAYDAAMESWPVPYEVMDIPGTYGTTHVVISGPRDAPPIVLLHGYWATLLMWTPNVAALSCDYRVYAIDVMGQPGRSVPGEAIRTPGDLVTWLSETMDALQLDHATLIGMSYGGWLALNFASVKPQRVESMVLLSPAASFLPLVRQFSMRGMLMMMLPSRITVNSFMRWLGFKDPNTDAETARVGARIVNLMYLGIKHFRIRRDAAGVAPSVFTDSALREVATPTLVLIGEREVIYHPAAALRRAKDLMPHVEGELVPRSKHDMSFRQYRHVNARILAFLGRIGNHELDSQQEQQKEAHV